VWKPPFDAPGLLAGLLFTPYAPVTVPVGHATNPFLMPDHGAPPPAVLRNNSVVGMRLVMPLFIVVFGWITYGLARQEINNPSGPLVDGGCVLINGAIWLFIIVATAKAYIQPRLKVTVSADGVLTREIWLWRPKRERRYAKADAFVPHLEESIDDERASTFKCTLWLPNRVLTIAEGNRTTVEETRTRLLAALAA